jgi:predicted permease
MNAIVRDLRYAARTLLRTPGFTLVVVATLALGIGANTAIFSVVNAVLLERLPYEEPDRLVAVWADVTERGGPADEWFNYGDFADLAAEPNLFESVGNWSTWQPTLLGPGDPEVIEAAMLSHEMLEGVLRTEPHGGRLFEEADDVPDALGVVVLTYASWQQRFGGDPAILGTTLTLSELSYTVVGVTPPGFRLPFRPEAELFRALGVIGPPGCGRGCFGTRVVGRLVPDVSLEVARARARDLAGRLESAYPDTNTKLSFTVRGLREDLTGGSAPRLLVLLGAVGMVLLIACMNVVNLLLVRGAAREGEIGVRVALGAGRGPIVRQLLCESLVLAAAGGVTGFALASWGTDALLALSPTAALPRVNEVSLDGRVLVFTAAVTLLTGILFGLFPSWRASRPGLYAAIRSVGGGAWGRGHLRNSVVVVEVATALVLLVGAGLLVKTFHRLNTTDLGFEPAGVLTFRVSLPAGRYEMGERRTFFLSLVDRLEALPGVEAAGAVNSLPLGGVNSDTDFYVEGQAPPAPGVSQAAWLRPVVDGYFEAVELHLVRGRGIAPSDDAEAPTVVVVNESLAQKYFGGDALGQRIAFESDPTRATWRTIVGVARDVRHFGIRGGTGSDPAETADAPAAYVPYRQFTLGQMAVVARVQGDPSALIPDVRRTLADLDRTLAASRIQTLQSLVDQALAPDKFVTVLLASFAATALLLSAIGLYGVVSYGVSRRMREMGIRRALGAEGADLGFMVVGAGLRLAGIGIVLGVAGSLALTQVLQGLLYDVEATDPGTFVATALLLAGVAVLASWLPARRAGRADPVSSLRQ